MATESGLLRIERKKLDSTPEVFVPKLHQAKDHVMSLAVSLGFNSLAKCQEFAKKKDNLIYIWIKRKL